MISLLCLVKLLDVSLGTRPQYSLVVDEDVKKPNKQTICFSFPWPHFIVAASLFFFSSYLISSMPVVFIFFGESIWKKMEQKRLRGNVHRSLSDCYEPSSVILLFTPTDVCLFGFLTSSSATRLYRQWVPRLTSGNFTCCHMETERRDHGFCLSQYR